MAFIKIVDALNHLATKKLEEVPEHVPLKYIQLIQLMHFASVNAVEGIWSQFKTRPKTHLFSKKIFLADKLSIPEFTQVLLATVHMVTANLDTIKIYSVTLYNTGALISIHSCLTNAQIILN